MSSINSVFFSKELTCLPTVLDRYVGKYYNNAIGNALTWAFFIWMVLHYAFDSCLKIILKKMRYPEFLRNRIASTVWNFGFFGISFVYCYASLSRSNVDIFSFGNLFAKKDFSVIPSQYILGFVILCSYYCHNSLWEFTQNYNIFKAIEELVFAFCGFIAYNCGLIELLYVLTYSSNLLKSILELARIFSFQIYNKFFMKMIADIYFLLHLSLCAIYFLVIMPRFILLPCIQHFTTNLTFSSGLLNIAIIAWMTLNICNSVASKIAKHYVYHDDETCKKTFIECAMFPPRDDTAFNVILLQKEIKDREYRLVSQRRRPTEILYQTLKCITQVRKKVEQRRENKRAARKESKVIVKEILDDVIDKICVSEESTEMID